MPSRTRHLRPRAFTLVELLVVIGIIAVLVGVLLPVLARVAERGRDLKCQANLRSVVQAVHGYAAENRGSMPWGWVFDRSDTVDGVICWGSLVSNYMDRSRPVVVPYNTGLAHDMKRLFAPALQCPEADQGRDHVISYAMSMVVAVSPSEELRIHSPGQTRALTRPTKQTLLLKETAVVWDTGLLHGWEQRPELRFGGDIDNQRIWAGAGVPQYRYFTAKDIFAHFTPGLFGQNRPVLLNVGGSRFYNRDPGPHDTLHPYQGNLRFRHGKNTTCNVGFSDGSVRQFTGKFKADKSLENPAAHDALRRYFMIKWPTG